MDPSTDRSLQGAAPNVRLEVHCDRSANLYQDLAARRIEAALLSCSLHSNAEIKNFIVTRVRRPRPGGSFWVVRRGVERSSFDNAEEVNLERYFHADIRTQNPRTIGSRNRPALKTCGALRLPVPRAAVNSAETIPAGKRIERSRQPSASKSRRLVAVVNLRRIEAWMVVDCGE